MASGLRMVARRHTQVHRWPRWAATGRGLAAGTPVAGWPGPLVRAAAAPAGCRGPGSARAVSASRPPGAPARTTGQVADPRPGRTPDAQGAHSSAGSLRRAQCRGLRRPGGGPMGCHHDLAHGEGQHPRVCRARAVRAAHPGWRARRRGPRSSRRVPDRRSRPRRPMLRAARPATSAARRAERCRGGSPGAIVGWRIPWTANGAAGTRAAATAWPRPGHGARNGDEPRIRRGVAHSQQQRLEVVGHPGDGRAAQRAEQPAFLVDGIPALRADEHVPVPRHKRRPGKPTVDVGAHLITEVSGHHAP